MYMKELISQGWQALLRDRMRSALTMLGIVWGLASVVLLLAYGQGLGGCVLHAFLNMGNNVIVMWPGQTSMQAGGQRGQNRPGQLHAVAELHHGGGVLLPRGLELLGRGARPAGVADELVDLLAEDLPGVAHLAGDPGQGPRHLLEAADVARDPHASSMTLL